MSRGPALGALLSLAGCLCPPTYEDALAVGFRSPEQTLRTFQTAVRADDATLEYRCLSSGFRERNGLSGLNWREMRDRLRKEQPWLRTGIAKAEIVSTDRDAQRVRLLVESYGHELEFELVREDFVELWRGAQLADEREIPFDRYVEIQTDGSGKAWLTTGAPLPANVAGSEITELRIGREWKIDGFRQLDENDTSPTPSP